MESKEQIENRIIKERKGYENGMIFRDNMFSFITNDYLDTLTQIEFINSKEKRTNKIIRFPTEESFNKINKITEALCGCTLSNREGCKEIFRTKFHFNDFQLDWIIPAKLIIEEIDKINSGPDFRISPILAFENISCFVATKINFSVIQFYLTDNKKKPYIPDNNSYLLDKIDNYKRNVKNRKQRGEFPIRNKEDLVFEVFMKIIEHLGQWLGTDKTTSDLIKNMFSGNMESIFLRKLFDENLIPLTESNSIRKKRRTIFPLFRLIKKDSHIMNEEEFEENDGIGSASNYQRYQEYVVKNILSKK